MGKKKKNNTIIYIIVLMFVGAGVIWKNQSKGDNHHNSLTKHQTLTYDISDEIIDGDTSLLECPRLTGGNHNYFVSHWSNGNVNYSLEYDITKHCPRWVAFTFDNINSQKNHQGRGKWQWDSQIPARYDISHLYRNSGYDRGHMVASEDRQYSEEANQQTFMMTNVCPQLHSFNAGMWKRLEQKVQSWGRNPRKRDVIYVAKGAILDDNEIETHKLGNKIAIPKYFWMALVAKKDNNYNGIAFLLEQREYLKGETIKDFAISIDELEEKIGIDLFHNLDDKIEESVEAQQPQSRESRRFWWN